MVPRVVIGGGRGVEGAAGAVTGRAGKTEGPTRKFDQLPGR